MNKRPQRREERYCRYVRNISDDNSCAGGDQTIDNLAIPKIEKKWLGRQCSGRSGKAEIRAVRSAACCITEHVVVADPQRDECREQRFGLSKNAVAEEMRSQNLCKEWISASDTFRNKI